MASDPREILNKKRKSRLTLVAGAPNPSQQGETPLDRVNRDLAILNMRLHGLTFHEIARKLPEAGFPRVSVSRIFAIVTKNLGFALRDRLEGIWRGLHCRRGE